MNLILHIPHSSKIIPFQARREFIISDEELEDELLKMTDSFTEDLYPSMYPRLVFPISRLVCDIERFRSDEDEEMSKKGMGAVYTRGVSGMCGSIHTKK